jgi:hypothetical protein
MNDDAVRLDTVGFHVLQATQVAAEFLQEQAQFLEVLFPVFRSRVHGLNPLPGTVTS